MRNNLRDMEQRVGPPLPVKIPGKSAKTLDIRYYQAQSVA
jgi:hypothetical protein